MDDDFSDLFDEGPTLIEEMDVEKFAERAARKSVRSNAELVATVLNDIVEFYRSHYIEEYTAFHVSAPDYQDYGVLKFTTERFPSDILVSLIAEEFVRWEERLGDCVIFDSFDKGGEKAVLSIHVQKNLARLRSMGNMPLSRLKKLDIRVGDTYGRVCLVCHLEGGEFLRP